jgi:uncharacterized cupredoxin-like copper-binding protein
MSNRIGAGWLKTISVLLALIAFVSACASQPAGPKIITVELSTYGIKPSADTMKAGDAIFRVTNKASDLAHEFIVVKTDLAPADLPYDSTNNIVPEDKITSMGEVSELEPGKSGELKVTLAAGKYLLICNIATHFKAGMVVPFTVTQ